MLSEDQSTLYTKIAAGAIAVYNAVEVLSYVMLTFKTVFNWYGGSIIVCCIGLMLNILCNNILESNYLDISFRYPLALAIISWIMYVMGFVICVYSRLSLVCQNKQILTGLKYFMMFNFVVVHLGSLALLLSLLGFNPNADSIINVAETINLSLILILECCLGVSYIVYIRKSVDTIPAIEKNHIVQHTTIMSIVVIILDISTLLIHVLGFYRTEIIVKVAVYSIKLKVEVNLINSLIVVFRTNNRDSDALTTKHATQKSVKK
ncbi:hypothetical protein BC833DRAFT_577949 [Globomyces pollinis-pini]|nr:hypothetical protein BC833DRAFT_577949 [Globomyces pollinis-pini]